MKTETPEDVDLPEPEPEEEKDGLFDFLKELPILVIVAFGIALLIKTFLLQAFFIPSESMRDTLLIKDRVLVAKFLYKLTEPKYGDVIVFISPISSTTPKEDHGPVGNVINSLKEGLGLSSNERDFIKRVIGTEGQTVQIKQGALFVDNKKLVEPYRKDHKDPLPLPDFGPLTVPKDKLFVMGDNRFNSQDSRVFGPISRSTVIGRAFVLIWPPSRFTLLGV